MRPNTAAEFWQRVDTSGGPDACHPWTGRRTEHGYGLFDIGGRAVRAHRFVMGEPDAVVRHTCDNPPCCNRRHLRVGTQADNVRDREERDRRDVRGERHPRAKFTAAQIATIRQRLDAGGTRTDLAREYGVSYHTIRLIHLRKNWSYE